MNNKFRKEDKVAVKSKILIIENDGIIAKDTEKILKKFGYSVMEVVFSGEEAVQKIREQKPDLVLSEIPLEGKMDGIETAHQIISILDIPVVFLTSAADRRTIERAKLIKPSGFIIKPFDEKSLYSAIEMALYRHRMNSIEKEENKTSKKEIKEESKSSESGLKDDWTRATFIVRKELLDKIKAVAYWDRKKVKDVVDEAFESYLKEKEIKSVKS
jgi:CheY-like chemotaxis protein